jgi:hypothetical protein
MDRENKALREKNRKKEIKKFLAFVETAYKIDPRIIAIKAAEKVPFVSLSVCLRCTLFAFVALCSLLFHPVCFRFPLLAFVSQAKYVAL